jgi:hypothetical protein
MALDQDVKSYLACWMQLGTKVFVPSDQTWRSVQHILDGTNYSSEFEAFWEQVRGPAAGDCYLEGTTVTFQDLLSNSWDIIDCARCDMPIAVPAAGIAPTNCPCHTLDNWPNTEIPCPRAPIDSQDHLKALQHRLLLKR